MKKLNLRKVWQIVAFLLLSVTLPMFNVYGAEITVKIGAAVDQTGPLSTEVQKIVTGWLWYQEYFNQVKGGWKDVNGNTVKMELLIGDTGFTPAKTVSLYKKFKAEGIVAIHNSGSVEVGAIRSMCLQDRIPMPTNSGSLIYPLPSPLFGHWADYSACSAAVVDYIKQKWGNSDTAWVKKRPPRLAFVGPEAYPSWEASITPEVIRYAKLQGIEVVGKFFIPLRPIDTKPQVLAAKAAGADFIYTGVVSSQGGAVIRDVFDLGLKGDPTKNEGKIEVIGMFPMSPADLIKLAGGREEAVNDIMIVGALADPSEDKPILRVIKKYAEKHGEMDRLDHNYFHPWYSGLITCKAIELALQKVPADKLKGNDVWESFLKIKDLDTEGILPNKVSFNEEKRLGLEKVRMDKVEGKKRILITNVDNKMLAPIYTEEYAKANGKMSIYSEESLKLLNLSAKEVGYKRIKE